MVKLNIFSVSSPVVKKIATAVALAVVVVLALYWLAGAFHPKIDDRNRAGPTADSRNLARPAGDVKTATVQVIIEPAVETAVGTIRAVHEAAIASKLLAKVVEVNVKAGQAVKQDEILVRLDDADLKARLQQAVAAADSARAARDQAKTEYDRVERLYQQANAARIEFDRADTAFKTTEANLNRAEQARTEAETILAYATIRAPIDGQVIDKKVEVGDMVTPGQVLVTLYDPLRMQLVARVRESLTRRLKVGEDIGVHVDALGKTCVGQVSEIVPEAESASRTFSVKVTGPCPAGIYSGMFGRLLIPLDERKVLAVPRAAVRRIGQLDVVEVVAEGRRQRRTVQLGRPLAAPNGQLVEVLAGLREGEQVVVPNGNA